MKTQIKEEMTLSGSYDVIVRRADTGEIVERQHVKNQLTTINQTSRDQMLLGTYAGGSDALQIKYFAFGTGTTPAAASDTQLVAEEFRKQLTTIDNPAPGTVETVCSLGTTEANFTIREIGIFCGPAATGTANSGTLLSRVLLTIYKNESLVVDIVRTDSCVI